MTTRRRGCRPSKARRARASGRSAASSWARARQLLSYTTTPPWASSRRGWSNAIRYSRRMPAGVSSPTTVRRSSSRRTTSTRSATTRSAGPVPSMLPVILTSKTSGLPGMAGHAGAERRPAQRRQMLVQLRQHALRRRATRRQALLPACQVAGLDAGQAGDEGRPHVGGGDRGRRRRRRMRVLRLTRRSGRGP